MSSGNKTDKVILPVCPCSASLEIKKEYEDNPRQWPSVLRYKTVAALERAIEETTQAINRCKTQSATRDKLKRKWILLQSKKLIVDERKMPRDIKTLLIFTSLALQLNTKASEETPLLMEIWRWWKHVRTLL